MASIKGIKLMRKLCTPSKMPLATISNQTIHTKLEYTTPRENSENFRFRTAIVRDHCTNFVNEALRMPRSHVERIDLDKAIEQKKLYDHILREVLGLNVIVLPANNDYPDGVFMQDTAVVIGDEALITHPGHDTRKGEVAEVEKEISRLGLRTTSMKDVDDEAIMDGGDVLFTGKEILVGLSRRTNMRGVKVMAEKFWQYPVTAIEIKKGLHLSSIMSLASPGILVHNNSTEGGRFAAKQVKEKAIFDYELHPVGGDVSAANCLYIDAPKTGKTIVHPSREGFPESAKVWESIPGVHKVPIGMTEIAKADGALTCCCIFLPV